MIHKHFRTCCQWGFSLTRLLPLHGKEATADSPSMSAELKKNTVVDKEADTASIELAKVALDLPTDHKMLTHNTRSASAIFAMTSIFCVSHH